jgi:hypothetical protein
MIYSKSMKDALQEVANYPEGDEEEEQLDESLVGLIRTTAITVNTAKGLQSGKKVQQHARELRGIGNELQRDKTPEDAQKTIAEGFRTLSDLFLNMEDMIRRNSYISASSGLFSDRTYNLLRKSLKKRR